VLDHFARIPEPGGAGDALSGRVPRLVDKGKTWVELAALRRAQDRPADLCRSECACPRVFKAAPKRLICGANLPQRGENPKPDDALLFDLLLD
jgi:hypothetical protein